VLLILLNFSNDFAKSGVWVLLYFAGGCERTIESEWIGPGVNLDPSVQNSGNTEYSAPKHSLWST
jgi:hypothetical protein